MQDRYEQQQDEYYRRLKEKRIRKKQVMNALGKNTAILFLANAFPFAIYFMFLSKLIQEQLSRNEKVAVLVCSFGLIAQIIMLTVFSILTYSKNEEERRALLHASREDDFNRMTYYINTWKKRIWVVPVSYAIMQLPFVLYYGLLGYFYEAETVFAHFYIPQLCFCELTRSGILGMLLNVILLSVIYAVVVFVVQKAWLRDRIRI